jgi:hypothetical protein
MTIEELKNKHSANIVDYQNVNTSIEFAINVLKEVGNKFETEYPNAKEVGFIIRNKDFIYEKIQELKTYLDEKI